MQKQINARLVQKSGFESEWLLATNFVPINGELIVYKAEADQNGNLFTNVTLPVGRATPYTYARFKIGDGYTLVNDLPFFAGAAGAGLPEVSVSNAGSILRVNSNGEWEVASVSIYDGSVVS